MDIHDFTESQLKKLSLADKTEVYYWSSNYAPIEGMPDAFYFMPGNIRMELKLIPVHPAGLIIKTSQILSCEKGETVGVEGEISGLPKGLNFTHYHLGISKLVLSSSQSLEGCERDFAFNNKIEIAPITFLKKAE